MGHRGIPYANGHYIRDVTVYAFWKAYFEIQEAQYGAGNQSIRTGLYHFCVISLQFFVFMRLPLHI